MVSLEALLALLDNTPVVASLHPVSRCYLPPDVVVYESASDLAWTLDRPNTTLPVRSLILQADPVYTTRFPCVCVDHDPFTPDLNDKLPARFNEVARLMLTQSHLAQVIAERVGTPDIVTLMLIDGLSYGDIRHWLSAHPNKCIELEPCLVDGPTLTEIAFPNIVSDVPPAARLFDRGYQQRIGFTYWTRENNPLTDLLFRTIPEVSTAGDFSTVLATLRTVATPGHRIYAQIVRTGLDGHAHHQKRKPQVEAIVNAIMNEALDLADLFRELGRTAHIYLTADHGILWRDEFVPKIIGRAPAGASPRSCEWRDLYQQDEPGQRFVVGGRELYCLGYPKLRRSLRIDEQGVHGGISFEESVVPFITIRIED